MSIENWNIKILLTYLKNISNTCPINFEMVKCSKSLFLITWNRPLVIILRASFIHLSFIFNAYLIIMLSFLRGRHGQKLKHSDWPLTAQPGLGKISHLNWGVERDVSMISWQMWVVPWQSKIEPRGYCLSNLLFSLSMFGISTRRLMLTFTEIG